MMFLVSDPLVARLFSTQLQHLMRYDVAMGRLEEISHHVKEIEKEVKQLAQHKLHPVLHHYQGLLHLVRFLHTSTTKVVLGPFSGEILKVNKNGTCHIKFDDDDERKLNPMELIAGFYVPVSKEGGVKEGGGVDNETAEAYYVHSPYEDINIMCRKVIQAGNEDFIPVYKSVWTLTAHSEIEGVEEYRAAVRSLITQRNQTRASNKQTTRDPCELYQHAGRIHNSYHEIVKRMVAKMKNDPKEVKLAPTLKKMKRIIEKTLLKRPEDPGKVASVFESFVLLLFCSLVFLTFSKSLLCAFFFFDITLSR